ncbi:hypothetical protein DMUE_0656 [Dictyocoela muelleri]|nr:hypothetical protein DMUE_0656 [Dictyocoela muelleri]
MNNESENLKESVEKIIKDNPYLTLNNESIFCSLCQKKLTFKPGRGLFNIKRHLLSYGHTRKTVAPISDSIESNTPIENNKMFQYGLIEVFTGLNIPLSKIDSNIFATFAEKFLPFPIYSSSYYRKTSLPELYQKKYLEAKNRFHGKDFYMIFDETTDSTGRNILCVLIGICGNERKEECLLVKTVSLIDTSSASLNRMILKSLYDFIGLEFDHKRIRLIISDQAASAKCTGKLLKELFPNLKHVTCLCHALHNVSEKIKDKSLRVNKIISVLKKWLVKNKVNKKIYKEIVNVPLTKFPILIRWGTMISFAVYLYGNFQAIRLFINAMDIKCGTKFFEVFNSVEFEVELRFV